MKHAYFLLFIVAALGFAACSRSKAFDPVNKTGDGLALRGYDAVAFFTDAAAVEGDPSFEYMWNGATWLFASAENLEKFKAAPTVYAPQFGGYCSYAVSKGYTADGDPATWKIVGGKLYLNYNQEAKQEWEKNQDRSIKDGQRNWNEFQTKKPEHKG